MISLEPFFFFLAFFSGNYLLLFRKRVFDFISIYTVILSLFSLTTLFGVVYNPYYASFTTVNPNVYIAMAIPFYVVIPFLLKENSPLQDNVYGHFEIKFFLKIVLILYILTAFLVLPSLVAATNKVQALEAMDLLPASLFGFLPVVGFWASLKLNSKFMLAVFAIFMVV